MLILYYCTSWQWTRYRDVLDITKKNGLLRHNYGLKHTAYLVIKYVSYDFDNAKLLILNLNITKVKSRHTKGFNQEALLKNDLAI